MEKRQTEGRYIYERKMDKKAREGIDKRIRKKHNKRRESEWETRQEKRYAMREREESEERRSEVIITAGQKGESEGRGR